MDSERLQFFRELLQAKIAELSGDQLKTLAEMTLGRYSVKDIQYGHLEDFIKSAPLKKLSDKTRHNIMSTLHFFSNGARNGWQYQSCQTFQR